MHSKQLCLIQLNAAKQRETQWSLLNDKETANADILLIQEPHIFVTGDGVPSAPAHPMWTTHLPTTISQTMHIRHSVRSLIWTHKRLTCTQIPVKSSDITAIMIEVARHLIVIISVYVPYGPTVNENGQLLQKMLKLIKATHQYAEQLKRKNAELLIGGDFNRHDQFWGGNQISCTPRQGEGARIIDFMLENDLRLLLARGTPTYESYNGVNTSTIDLSLASQHLQIYYSDAKFSQLSMDLIIGQLICCLKYHPRKRQPRLAVVFTKAQTGRVFKKPSEQICHTIL